MGLVGGVLCVDLLTAQEVISQSDERGKSRHVLTKTVDEKSETRGTVYIEDLMLVTSGNKAPELGEDILVSAEYKYYDSFENEEGASAYGWYFNGEYLSSAAGLRSINLGSDYIQSKRGGILTLKVTPRSSGGTGNVAGSTETTSIYIGHHRDGIPETVFSKSWLNQSANHGFNSLNNFEDKYFASTANDAYAYIDDNGQLKQGGNSAVTDMLGTYIRYFEDHGVKQLYSNKASLAALLDDGVGTFIAWGGGMQSTNFRDAENKAFIKEGVAAVYPGIDEYVIVNTSGELKVAKPKDGELSYPPLSHDELEHLKNNVRAVYRSGSDLDNAPYAYAVLTKDYRVYAWGAKEAGGVMPQDVKDAIADNHAIAVYATRSAFTVLLGNLTVVSWGNEDEGGKTPPLDASYIRNITASSSSFTALKQVAGGTSNQHKILSWGRLESVQSPNIQSYKMPEIFAAENAFLVVDMQPDSSYRAEVWGDIDQSSILTVTPEKGSSSKELNPIISSTNNSFALLTPEKKSSSYKVRMWGRNANISANNEVIGFLKSQSMESINASQYGFIATFMSPFEDRVLSWSDSVVYTSPLQDGEELSIDSIYTSSSNGLISGYGCLQIYAVGGTDYKEVNSCIEDPTKNTVITGYHAFSE